MSYVTDGTFWVVVLIMAGVIGVMWYSLKKEIDKIQGELKTTQKILAKGAHDLGDAYDNDAKAHNAEMADVYETLATLTKEIVILRKKADKKTRDEMDAIFAEYNKKRANHDN